MSAGRTGARTVAALALVIAGCGGPATSPRPPAPRTAPTPAPADVERTPVPAPAPAPPVDPLAAQVEAMVRGYEAIAAAAGPDAPCPALARTITATVSASGAERQAVRVAAAGDRAAEVDALMVAAGARLTPAIATVDAAIRRCAGEPAVGRALAALDHQEPP